MQQPSIFGQIPLNFYTQVLLGFLVRDDGDFDRIVELLTVQSEALADTFPHLSGNVILRGRNQHCSGTYEVIAHQRALVHVKDCRELCPSYADIVAANATGSVLDSNLLSPMKGIPEHHTFDSDGLPVWLLQLNRVRGGLILCSSCMHQSLDMNGHGHLLNMLAKCCRGEPLTVEEKASGNVDIAELLSSLHDSEPLLDVSALRHDSNLNTPEISHDGAAISAPWVYFRFPSSSVRDLKSAAMSGAAADTSGNVTSNDCITAFIWQSLARARATRFSPQEEMLLGRLVDVRQRLRPLIPSGYMGHLLLLDENSIPFQTLLSKPLSEIASHLRRSLHKYDSHYVYSLTYALRAEQDKSIFRYGANGIAGKDVTISSWAGLKIGRQSYGELLGVPTFVRRPHQADAEGLVFLLPAAEDGSVDFTMSLRTEDLKSLNANEDWSRLVVYLG